MRGWLHFAFCWLAQSTIAPTAYTSTPTPPPFSLPKLPISKADALYPDCRAEFIFVLDVSGSVSPPNQQTMFRFVVKFMIAIEQNVLEAKFGVVVFGISYTNTNSSSKWYDRTEFGEPILYIPPPYGNNRTTSTELLLGLGPLRYGCAECIQIGRPAWSQLEMMYALTYRGHLTPTWDGLDLAREEFNKHGDPSVPGRFVVLITDGIPNGDNCVPPLETPIQPACVSPLNQTSVAVNAAKEGTLLLTVGLQLDNTTAPLMLLWASEPKEILAIPSADYSQLSALIPKLSRVSCPKAAGGGCLAEGATSVNITGEGFLDTGTIFCRFFRDGEALKPEHLTRGIFVDNATIICPLPTGNWSAGEWILEYTRDGRGYYKAARIKTASLCQNNTSEGSVHAVGYGLVTVFTAFLLYF